MRDAERKSRGLRSKGEILLDALARDFEEGNEGGSMERAAWMALACAAKSQEEVDRAAGRAIEEGCAWEELAMLAVQADAPLAWSACQKLGGLDPRAEIQGEAPLTRALQIGARKAAMAMIEGSSQDPAPESGRVWGDKDETEPKSLLALAIMDIGGDHKRVQRKEALWEALMERSWSKEDWRQALWAQMELMASPNGWEFKERGWDRLWGLMEKAGAWASSPWSSSPIGAIESLGRRALKSKEGARQRGGFQTMRSLSSTLLEERWESFKKDNPGWSRMRPSEEEPSLAERLRAEGGFDRVDFIDWEADDPELFKKEGWRLLLEAGDIGGKPESWAPLERWAEQASQGIREPMPEPLAWASLAKALGPIGEQAWSRAQVEQIKLGAIGRACPQAREWSRSAQRIWLEWSGQPQQSRKEAEPRRQAQWEALSLEAVSKAEVQKDCEPGSTKAMRL